VLEQDHYDISLLLGKFEEALGQADFAQALSALDLFWARLAMHIRAEHLCLFPVIINASMTRSNQIGLPSPEVVSTTIATLRADHDHFMHQLAKSIAILRQVVAGPEKTTGEQIDAVRAAVAEVKKRLEEHNRIEEELVYQWPLLLLSNETA
jgi:hemerythrin superfamily protein